MKKFTKILAANRSEIAIRIFRAANELQIKTVAIYSHEDRFALHRFKADEAYLIGEGKDPVKAYLDIEGIIALAIEKGVDAIHPGYGFLSENAQFAKACEAAEITFIGPNIDILEGLGNKTEAKKAAVKVEVPVLSGSLEPVKDEQDAKQQAEGLGYPVIIKASNGGGGRGMRVVREANELLVNLEAAKSESEAAFGSDEVFIEKFIEKAKHIEVQILGDKHGNIVHLWDRDCSIQRRHQKVIEMAPSVGLSEELRENICASAVKICSGVGYSNAGTVEFLLDTATNRFYFIEVNPRIQVEHTVTEVITGRDIVKSQILVAQGNRLDSAGINIKSQQDIKILHYAFQCRLTTEDPQNSFIPDYGKIEHYRSSGGIGIRLDAGTAFSGAVVTPYYDSMLVKVTAQGDSFESTVDCMRRALAEFRIRGVKTNIPFLLNLTDHQAFRDGQCTTRFIDENPQLFNFPKRRDRVTRLLRYVGDVLVNGHPLIKEQQDEVVRRVAPLPKLDLTQPTPKGFRDILMEQGPEGLNREILSRKEVLITDTTMRDAHQSLLATRMRTYDMHKVAQRYAHEHSDLFSMEMWGGATFDVSMRFLNECPWERLRKLREACPNVLFQMLLRASNAVGYKNYPDNVVKGFIKQAAAAGMDIFRVFDSLNWVENMKLAMDAVIEAGAVCEAVICYTGDILDESKPKYNLDYYVNMAKELESHGAHIIAIKDMAGLLKPYAAYQLIKALKETVKVPIHLHTHDTSSGQMATLVKATEAGVDIIDAAFGPLSGLTSQANLNTFVEHLRFTERDPKMDFETLQKTSEYWEVVRSYYKPFETLQKFGAADVYRHEMPGGQYTNLFQQAASMGLAERWYEVCNCYAEVNQFCGDIVKVTPSSKVVGDFALMLVTNNLKVSDLSTNDMSYPQSVVDMMAGWLGQPEGGFPKEVQQMVLKGETAIKDRPGKHMEPVDIDLERSIVEKKIGREVSENELYSYLMYPQVFTDYAEANMRFGDVSVVPTPVFFNGLEQHEEVSIQLEEGKTLYIKLVAISPENSTGESTVFFELNGQPREITITLASSSAAIAAKPKADKSDDNQVGAPMPGMISELKVKVGDSVEKGEALAIMEAMKMETTICAETSGEVSEVLVVAKETVKAGDLLIQLK